MQLFDMDNYKKLKRYHTIIVTPEFVARFEAKVVRDDCMTDGCHVWTSAKNNLGYGQFSYGGKSLRANRASFAIYNGNIPHGMHVCHRCDNPPCVNPAHLFLGTASENMRDKIKKGRDINSSKTHCPQGHEYSGDNLYLNPNRKNRICKTCNKQSALKYRAKL